MAKRLSKVHRTIKNETENIWKIKTKTDINKIKRVISKNVRREKIYRLLSKSNIFEKIFKASSKHVN